MLNAALRLCEIGGAARQDPRVRLAAARVRESAANTPEFRAAIPRVQTLLANSSEDWPELNAALLHAAMDGVPRLDAEALARASGILTEWRIVGPLGRHPLLDFDQLSISPNDDLTQTSYDNRAVENFQFPDGIISLPSYLPSRGNFLCGRAFCLARRWEPGPFASKASGRWKFTWMASGCCGKMPACAELMFVARPRSKSRPVHIACWRNSPAPPPRLELQYRLRPRRYPLHQGPSCRRRSWLTIWLRLPTPAGSLGRRSSKSVRCHRLPFGRAAVSCWPSRGRAENPTAPEGPPGLEPCPVARAAEP